MKILFISLGCDKNLVDSEQMLGTLAGRGYEMTDREEEADIIIINTCCFIDSAKEESVNTILEMAPYRKEGRCRALVVTGCMAERYRKEVMDEIAEVDAIIGTNGYDQIDRVIDLVEQGEKPAVLEPLTGLPERRARRVMTTGGFYEYLKIAEGCDKHCTYCIIPKLRGSYRSVPMEDLLEEARDLAGRGVRELILVAQETTRYGLDLYGEKRLHVLLRELCRIGDLKWIRILYCYPEEIYPELVDTIASEPKICRYMDLPIQHASDPILARMGRKTSREDLVSIIGDLRSKVEGIALRTTLITGFPGETEEEHRELLDFIEEMKFTRLGAFPYSREEGTPAAEMEDQVDEEVKSRRLDEILSLQQDISLENGQAAVGEWREVLIEGYLDEEHVYVGRTQADAPGVDGYCFVHTGEVLHSGDLVRVRITGAMEYDLIGEYSDESAE